MQSYDYKRFLKSEGEFLKFLENSALGGGGSLKTKSLFRFAICFKFLMYTAIHPEIVY